ncbi:MAG: hypothetical protein ABID40_03170, partial [Candidatus Bipolaricaulota bacterium]
GFFNIGTYGGSFQANESNADEFESLLEEGENTIFLSVTDVAGNVATAQWTIWWTLAWSRANPYALVSQALNARRQYVYEFYQGEPLPQIWLFPLATSGAEARWQIQQTFGAFLNPETGEGWGTIEALLEYGMGRTVWEGWGSAIEEVQDLFQVVDLLRWMAVNLQYPFASWGMFAPVSAYCNCGVPQIPDKWQDVTADWAGDLIAPTVDADGSFNSCTFSVGGFQAAYLPTEEYPQGAAWIGGGGCERRMILQYPTGTLRDQDGNPITEGKIFLTARSQFHDGTNLWTLSPSPKWAPVEKFEVGLYQEGRLEAYSGTGGFEAHPTWWSGGQRLEPEDAKERIVIDGPRITGGTWTDQAHTMRVSGLDSEGWTAWRFVLDRIWVEGNEAPVSLPQFVHDLPLPEPRIEGGLDVGEIDGAGGSLSLAYSSVFGKLVFEVPFEPLAVPDLRIVKIEVEDVEGNVQEYPVGQPVELLLGDAKEVRVTSYGWFGDKEAFAWSASGSTPLRLKEVVPTPENPDPPANPTMETERTESNSAYPPQYSEIGHSVSTWEVTGTGYTPVGVEANFSIPALKLTDSCEVNVVDISLWVEAPEEPRGMEQVVGFTTFSDPHPVVVLGSV